VYYLARGAGAAIRREPPLPGGGSNPVEIVHGCRGSGWSGTGSASRSPTRSGTTRRRCSTSFRHCGRRCKRRYRAVRGLSRRRERCGSGGSSEIVADLWSGGKLGSTLGQIGIVSLPSWVVFQDGVDDPHPVPWIRAKLSCGRRRALPAPAVARLRAVLALLYSPETVDERRQELLAALRGEVPDLRAAARRAPAAGAHEPVLRGDAAAPEQREGCQNSDSGFQGVGSGVDVAADFGVSASVVIIRLRVGA
jgi:hypothetical protein